MRRPFFPCDFRGGEEGERNTHSFCSFFVSLPYKVFFLPNRAIVLHGPFHIHLLFLPFFSFPIACFSFFLFSKRVELALFFKSVFGVPLACPGLQSRQEREGGGGATPGCWSVKLEKTERKHIYLSSSSPSNVSMAPDASTQKPSWRLQLNRVSGSTPHRLRCPDLEVTSAVCVCVCSPAQVRKSECGPWRGHPSPPPLHLNSPSHAGPLKRAAARTGLSQSQTIQESRDTRLEMVNPSDRDLRWNNRRRRRRKWGGGGGGGRQGGLHRWEGKREHQVRETRIYLYFLCAKYMEKKKPHFFPEWNPSRRRNTFFS